MRGKPIKLSKSTVKDSSAKFTPGANEGPYAIISMQGGGTATKEVTPMSVSEVISLLMLVLAAIALGISIK